MTVKSVFSNLAGKFKGTRFYALMGRIADWFKTGIEKIGTGIHNWFFGTDAKPVPVFCRRARLYRWYLKTFRGYVDLHITYWDEDAVEYKWEVKLVPKSDIPRDSVAISSLKKAYHTDLDNPRRGFSTVDDNGFTAVSAWLYMKCNKFEDAMRVNLDNSSNIDFRKLITIAAIALGIFLGLYYYTMQ